MNFRYPVFLDISGKKCLVVGDGDEMAAKANALSEAGADVVRVQARDFKPEDLAGCFLVVTNQADNAEAFRVAEQRGVLCNAVDDPEHCRFIFGSVHRQGDLTIATSTNGVAPAVSVRVKEQLHREFGPEYGVFLEVLKAVRGEIAERIGDFDARRELWYQIVDSEVLALLRAGKREAAQQVVRALIDEAALSSTSRSGISRRSDDH